MELTDQERQTAQQIARNTGQPVQVVDVRADETPDYYYSGHMNSAEQERYGQDIARGMSPREADYGIWLDRGREELAADIREQQTNRQLQTGMAEKEGGQ